MKFDDSRESGADVGAVGRGANSQESPVGVGQGRPTSIPLAGDRLLVAVWATLCVVAARAGLEILVDFQSEGLRGALLFENALEHARRGVGESWALLLLFALLPFARHSWLRWLRAAIVGGAAVIVVSGLLEQGQPEYTPGLVSLRGYIGWACIFLFAVVLVRIDRWWSDGSRPFLRGGPAVRFSVTAGIVVLGGGALFSLASFVEAERRFIVLEGTPKGGDLLERFKTGQSVTHRGRVELDRITPQVGLSAAGGGRESLVLSLDSSVSFSLKPRGDSSLVFSYGADLESVREVASRRPDWDPQLQLEVSLDGTEVFRGSWSPTRELDDRRWFDARVSLDDTQGRSVEVTILLSSEDEGAALVRAGLADLAVHRRERIARRASSSDRLNLLLVNVDSLRTDCLRSLSGSGHGMPFLDEEIVPRSVLYERAIAASSWTWPSVASLFSGVSPEVHGVVDEDRSFLSDRVLTVAERLQMLGVTTGGWSSNAWIGRDKNFDQGFAVWREFEQKKDPLLVREFEEFVHRYDEFQFFGYVHLSATRAPYRPGARALRELDLPTEARAANRGMSERALQLAAGDPEARPSDESLEALRSLYQAAAVSVDETLRGLWDVLWRHGLLDRTIVVVTSAHGEEFLDHGGLQHGWSLFEETVRVPLLIRHPQVAAGRITQPVELTALPRSILDWFGWTLPLRTSSSGLPPFTSPERRPFAFSTTQRSIPGVEPTPRWFAIQNERLKLIGEVGGVRLLFDLIEDPGETRDVSDDFPDEVADLEQRYERWLENQRLLREKIGTEAVPAVVPSLDDTSPVADEAGQ